MSPEDAPTNSNTSRDGTPYYLDRIVTSDWVSVGALGG
jgi:hypothetical protein